MKQFTFFTLAFLFFSVNLSHAQYWSTTGNAGTTTSINFLGTTDNKPLVLRTKNTDRLRITQSGDVGIGTRNPQQKLDVNGNINISSGSALYIGNTRVLYTKNGSFFAGQSAGDSLTTGFDNVGVGRLSLWNNTDGHDNTAIGEQTLSLGKTGNNNTAVGWAVLTHNVGSFNTACGDDAMFYNTSGLWNTAVGVQALISNTTGNENTASGSNALINNTTASYNTGYGFNALSTNSTGNNNTACGYAADLNDSVGITNSTAIGSQALITASNQVRIGNNDVTSIGGYTDWSNISDGRVKKNIKENVPGLSFINKLNSVTYNLNLDAADKIIQRRAKKDKDGKIIQLTHEDIAARTAKEKIVYTGFVAQDVEKAAKGLNYDFSGVNAPKNDKDLYGLRYAEFVVPLVKAVQELSKENDELKARLDRLEQLMSVNSDMKSSVTLSDARIDQNVPNPFNENTIINYYTPAKTNSAALRINDMNGRVLKSFPIASKGNGQLVVKANDLSAGTYQYSLMVNGKIVDSKKMIVQ